MPEIPETIGPRAGTSPVTVTLTETGTVDLEGSFAHYDGSGAGGSFLPALTIRSQDGSILSRVFPSTTLASGDTADVTFVPLGEAESSSGGSGIQFDTDPQTGDWLVVNTTTDHSGVGMHITDQSAGGIDVEALSATGALFLASNGSDPLATATLWATSAGAVVRGDTGILIQTDTGPNGISILSNGGAIRLVPPANSEVALRCSGGAGRIALHLDAAGTELTVRDAGDNSIFEVREDGSIHGLASVGAITWDL